MNRLIAVVASAALVAYAVAVTSTPAEAVGEIPEDSFIVCQEFGEDGEKTHIIGLFSPDSPLPIFITQELPGPCPRGMALQVVILFLLADVGASDQAVAAVGDTPGVDFVIVP